MKKVIVPSENTANTINISDVPLDTTIFVKTPSGNFYGMITKHGDYWELTTLHYKFFQSDTRDKCAQSIINANYELYIN